MLDNGVHQYFVIYNKYTNPQNIGILIRSGNKWGDALHEKLTKPRLKPCSRCRAPASSRSPDTWPCNYDTGCCSGRPPRTRRDRPGWSGAAGRTRWAPRRLCSAAPRSPAATSWTRSPRPRSGSSRWRSRPAAACWWRGSRGWRAGCSSCSWAGARSGSRRAAGAGSAAPGSGTWARCSGSRGSRIRWRGSRCARASSAGTSWRRFCCARAGAGAAPRPLGSTGTQREVLQGRVDD